MATSTYLDGYGTNAKTPAQIAALTKCTIDDFKTGLSYLVPRQIGMANISTDPDPVANPVWEARYELVPKTVYRATINQDLLEFESLLKQGRAVSPTAGTPSEFALQSAKTKGIILDDHGKEVVAIQEELEEAEAEAESAAEAPTKKVTNGNGGSKKK